MRTTLLLLMLAALAGGCSASTSSRNIRTAGMVALIDVTSINASESVVSADLVIGGANSNTYVLLEGGDRMFAEAHGQRLDMGAVGKGKYQCRFARGEGEVVVGLERDEDSPAPNSRGTLPIAFEITNQFGGEPISRKHAITLTWSPKDPGAEMQVELRGSCIHNKTFKVPGDSGAFTLKVGDVRAWKSKADEACDVAVRVQRSRLGTPDPTLGRDSRVRLHQVRETRFVSGP